LKAGCIPEAQDWKGKKQFGTNETKIGTKDSWGRKTKALPSRTEQTSISWAHRNWGVGGGHVKTRDEFPGKTLSENQEVRKVTIRGTEQIQVFGN